MSTNVEQIKEKLDIVDVISGYIKVEKAGLNYKARCPFHNEKTPSFFISPGRQSFYCFGCGEKGDVFTFVEKFEGLDFKESLSMLADRAGIKLEKFKGANPAAERGEADEKEKLFEAMEAATEFFERRLAVDKASLTYLKKRGLSDESIKKWRVGLAHDEWRGLHDHLLAKKFSRETLLDAGLLKKAAEGEGKYYDTFRHRITFPIFDPSGRVVAFSGRAMREDEKTPKYLNSPETKIFHKSEILYGFNVAKNHIRKQDYAVLVEGQMDLLLSQQAGVSNTVASSGTALSVAHLQKIQKLSNRVIIAYDADSAGEKAALRAAELALALGMETKIATLPEGEDPASLAQKDPSAWKEVLRASSHFLDFLLETAVRKNQGQKLTKEILKNVLPLVHLIQSEVEKSQFIKKIALKMRVSEEAVWSDLQKSKVKTPQFEEVKNFDRDKDKKEALLFEAERYGLKIDRDTIDAEILKRVRLQRLKEELQETASILDEKDLSETAEKEAKEKLSEIQKNIKELS